jgi:serine/threonine protein phosphatase PrpC/predicted Ser/Thr protein kinase
MPKQLTVSVGQYSDKGRKQTNQDFYGVCIPDEPLLSLKGIAAALADGISSSDVSQIASESAIKSFLSDYYCTSEAWPVKTSGQRVLGAINSWLFSQTHRSEFRYDQDRGYVCTFSALVIKSATAHIFHAGDTRIYCLQNNVLEQLTNDHRLRISDESSYLSRALGISAQLDFDYRALPVAVGDIFILVTDGVYEHLSAHHMMVAIQENAGDLNAAAKRVVSWALENGSEDNLTAQLVRVDELPEGVNREIYQQLLELPFPPALEPRAFFDGYQIVRQIYASSRSHVYLAVDQTSQSSVVIKVPATEMRADDAYMERFFMEEWIARRIHNPHVLKADTVTRQRLFAYSVTEFIDGQTLTQWMIDHPRPDVETVRGIVEQIAKGLRAFHRLEMLHQDLRPDNIMIDRSGTVKIIDFGSTRVAGLAEIDNLIPQPSILGTAQYTAPEYFLGEQGTVASDLFSLAVITYQMLCGQLPYGAEVAKSRTRTAQKRLVYRSVLDEDREIPAWLDDTLKKAVHPNPQKRYAELSEFIYDLRHPGKSFLTKTRPPLMERNPLMFWRVVSFILAVMVVILLAKLTG